VTDRWFDDIPEHDPNDPDAVARALRRQERAAGRGSDRKAKKQAKADRKAAAAAQSAADASARAASEEAPARAPAPFETSEHEYPGTEEHPLAAPRRPERPTGRRSRRGSGSGGPHYGRLALFGGVAACILIGLFLIFSIFQPFHGDGEGEPFNVNVPSGSVGDVASLLKDRGVISNATMFQINATVTGKRSKIYHGIHSFKKNMSYSAALEELGKQPPKKTVTVVLPEGLSRSEMANVVEAAGLPGDYMAATEKSPDLNPDDYGADGKAKNLEGFLWPATYELKPGSDVQDLVDQQLQAFKDNIASVNMKYAKKKNLTVYDVLTIASMIEREVSNPKERAKVAEVIYNRLKQGEPLGIDATIRFALDNWDKALTESDLAVDSPYNTRLNQGLPPGPIGSPGLASIEAAAHPDEGDLLFYVVKPGACNEHVFSSTLEQFNKDAAAYQQALEEKGSSPTTCK